MSKLSRKENKTQVFDSPTPEEPPQVQPDKEDAEATVPDHPHPLRSHPNVKDFRYPAGQIQPPITPDPQVKSAAEKDNAGGDDNDSEDKDHRLSEGFTASETTGELSHHTRTPTPIVKVDESETIKQRTLEETPTKQPAYKRLKKSMSGFFARSASMMRLTTNTPAAHTTINDTSAAIVDTPTVNTTIAEVPAVQTPTRQTTIQEGNEQQETGIAGIEAPTRTTHHHQPVTPSPLRNSSRPDVSEVGQGNQENETAISSAIHTTGGNVKIYGPRSPTSASNPEKRRAMYGDSFKGFRLSRVNVTETDEE